MGDKVRPTIVGILQLRSVLAKTIQPRHFFKNDDRDSCESEQNFCQTLFRCAKTSIELRAMDKLQFGFCLFTFHRLASLSTQENLMDLFWPLFQLQPTTSAKPTSMASIDERYAWFIGNPSTTGTNCNPRYPVIRDCTPLPDVISSLTLEYEFLNTLDVNADRLFIGRLICDILLSE